MSLRSAIDKILRLQCLAIQVEEEIEDAIFGHGPHPWLIIESNGAKVAVQLIPHRRIKLMTTVNLGHTISYAIAYFDTNGNPMLTTPTPDAAPAWSNTTSATATLAVAADGLSAVETPVAEGSDTVTVSLAVGSVPFAASDDVTVSAAPQVLGSIKLVPTVN